MGSRLKEARQLELEFDVAFRGTAGFSDPAFSENRGQPVHRWVPWVAGFSSAFVQDCFERYLSKASPNKRPCVLDPFAGVGTTLLQAHINGFDTIGCEINPFAALVCKIKLNACTIEPDLLRHYLKLYRESDWLPDPAMAELRPREFRSKIPFFSPAVEEQVLQSLAFIESIAEPEVADLFRMALGSVMVSFSNYSYEPSLSSRPSSGKPLVERADVRKVVSSKLAEILEDICYLRERCRHHSRLRAEVHAGDFFAVQGAIPDNSVDLVVTSPPYMNNYHYVRNTRPQLLWLSLISSPKQLRSLEEGNFGKFWQSVRDAEPVALQFLDEELTTVIEQIRATRVERGAYGGPGWANYVATYLNDCYRFCCRLQRLLVPGGVAVVVIGNSIIQGHEVKTDLALSRIARQAGLDVLSVEEVRAKRVGTSIVASSVRQGAALRRRLYESAVVLQKA